MRSRARFTTLMAVEARRALSRRAVHALLLVGALGALIAGVVARIKTTEFGVATGDVHIGRLTDLWRTEGDSTLLVATLFLGIGSLIGGATVTGGEWRHGTVTTVLTWMPRRGRLLGARIAAAAVLAAVLSLALLALLALALTPTWLGPGTTEGVDGEWATRLVAALARTSLLCGMAAAVGAAVASIGRSTAAALAAAFVQLSIVEGVVRGVFPGQSRWLFGENIATFVPWRAMENAPFERSPGAAAATLAWYGALLVAVAVVQFRRRDLVGTA